MTRIKIQKLHPERRLDRMERAGNGSRRTGKKTGMKTRCAMVKCEKSKIGTVQNLNSAVQNGGKSWEWQESWQEDWGGSKARCLAEAWCNALLSLLIFPPKTRDLYARPRMRSGEKAQGSSHMSHPWSPLADHTGWQPQKGMQGPTCQEFLDIPKLNSPLFITKSSVK